MSSEEEINKAAPSGEATVRNSGSTGGRRERKDGGEENPSSSVRKDSLENTRSDGDSEKREDGRERRRSRGSRRRSSSRGQGNGNQAAKSEDREKKKEGPRGGRGRQGQRRNDRDRSAGSRDARTDKGASRGRSGSYKRSDPSERNASDKPREEVESLSAAELFKKGQERLKEDRMIEACKLFKRAFKSESENAEYMSYCGLASATGFGEIKLGLELCTRAIKYECSRPEFYANLAKVYIASGNKKGAIMALTKGTRYEISGDSLHQMLVDIGVRKQSILPFMKRSSFINKGLGILFRRTLPGFRSRRPVGK